MKLPKKKLAALNVLVWAVLCMLSLVALMLTERSAFGFTAIFTLIWFLYEDKEYKEKYPEKKEGDNP